MQKLALLPFSVERPRAVK